MALVVFHDHGCHPLDRFLKQGFRHVFCAVAQGDYWIVIDSMAGRPVVKVVAGTTFDLAAFYRNEGMTVVETEGGPGIRAPFAFSNCVGMVKAVLGIRAPFRVTPYQLFRFLRRRT
jgi:hypothetical protein